MGKKQRIFPQEIFDTIFEDAVIDLRKSGFNEEEVFAIIQEQFGTRYANKFCEKDS